jgi:hypothetical protein
MQFENENDGSPDGVLVVEILSRSFSGRDRLNDRARHLQNVAPVPGEEACND